MIFRVLLIIILAGLIFSLIRKHVSSSSKKKLIKRMEERFFGQNIILTDLSVNLIGQVSEVPTQTKITGALVLTEIELWFSSALPERELTIPLSSIKSVNLVKNRTSRISFQPLLQIEFFTGTTTNSAYWAVKNPQRWKIAIDNIRSKNL